MEKIKRPVGRPRKTPPPPPAPQGEGIRRALNKVREMAADSSMLKPYSYPIKPPELPPGVVPKGQSAPVMAMDLNPYEFASQTYPGGGFPGFPYLSQLATRAEYRAFASTLSTELIREWIKFTSKQDDDTDTAEKIKLIEDEFKRLDVRGVMQLAAQHDSYFGRAQIFIDIEGHKRDKPLVLDPRTVKTGSLKSVVPVEAMWTTPYGYNALDPAAPDFYRPHSWFMLGQQVHASRLMTVITRPLPDMLKPAFNFAGMSLSQLAEPYVDNWLRTRQSVADLINNFSITALATSMDQVLQGDDDGTNIFKRAELFTATRSNKGLMLLDKEREEIVQVNVPLSGLHELQAQSQEHMCLSKGTLIETKRGQIPIEKVLNTDEVMTRDGYAPVEWAGVTKQTSSFVEIETDISILRVTPEHPIWSESKNAFVNAENVDHSHRLQKSPAWEFMGNLWHGAGDCGVSQNQDILETPKPVGYCIASCIKRISGRFLKALTYITKMATLQTMRSTILNCSPVPNIPQSMSPKDGSQPLKGNLQNAVTCVVLNTKRYGQTEPNSAQENVKQKPGSCANEDVYNIKVSDGFLPEFYANGILVHNCSVSRTPAIILTGISPSGLNASSDGEIRVFYDWITAQQNAFWRDPLETILKVVQLSLFGEIDPDIGFEFTPLYQMTPKELSEIRFTDMQTAQGYCNIGSIDPSEVRDRLAKDPESGYDGLDISIELVAPTQLDGEDAPDGLGGAEDKSVSEKQHRAMEAAAHGKSTLGIPKKVGKEFVSKDG